MKTRTLLGILAGVVTAGIGLENTGPVSRDCEVYQGYTVEPSDGKIFYVFDPQKEYNRPGEPKYVMEGDSELEGSLKIGQRYCFEVRDPKAPWAYKKLVKLD